MRVLVVMHRASDEIRWWFTEERIFIQFASGRAEGSDHSGEQDRVRSEKASEGLSSPQLIRVQSLKIFREEQAVFPDHLAIEGNGATAIIGPLDQNHVPVDRRLVAVVGVFVGIARREVQTARNLFIKKNVVLRA